MAREEPLYYLIGNESDATIGFSIGGTIRFMVPPIESKAKHNQFMRDMERLQWFAVGHGYTQTPETWTGKFEQEEYNCVIRYLNKFGWALAKPCESCGTTVESK